MLWHFDHDVYRMTYSLKVQATRINLSQGKTKLVRVDGEITLTKFKLADGIYYTQSAVPHLWDLICNLFTWPSRIEFTSAIAIFKFIPLLYKIISGHFDEESVFSNRPKTLLYLQNGKAQISISSVSQTKELITNTGNRDQVFLATPLGLFSNLPGPLPITSCVKTDETC